MNKIYGIGLLLYIMLVLMNQVVCANEIAGKKHYLIANQLFRQDKLEMAIDEFNLAVEEINGPHPKGCKEIAKSKEQEREEFYIWRDSLECIYKIGEDLIVKNKGFNQVQKYYRQKNFSKAIDLFNTIIKNAEQKIAENKELDLIESLIYEKSRQYLCNIYKNMVDYEKVEEVMEGLGETENWAKYQYLEIYLLKDNFIAGLSNCLELTGGTNYDDYKYVELSRLVAYIIIEKQRVMGNNTKNREDMIDYFEEINIEGMRPNIESSWVYQIYLYFKSDNGIKKILEAEYDVIETLSPYGGVGDRSRKELPWIYNIIRYYEGKVDLKVVIAGATNKEKQCTTYYFIGEKYILDGQQEKAQEYFNKAIATDAWDAPGYDLARKELEIL